MKRSIKTTLSAVLAAAMTLCSPCAANAAEASAPWYGDGCVPASAYVSYAENVYAQESLADESVLQLDCRAAVLMEPETGSILYAKSPDERLPEASITKVMTALLVFEALDAGRLSLEDTAVCSEYAASMGGSQIWLEPGEEMTVHELLKATMVGSANDASVVLAEKLAGSHESFVAMMNDRAAGLGLTNTAYKNCTGLDAEGHVTSARDIAIVSAELLRHEKVRDYSTIWMDTMRGGQLQLVNTNKLVHSYEGVTGLKTGTTSQAGCCLAASAEREGMSLIAVIMGAPNSKTRFACARKLLDYGFAGYELLALEGVKAEVPGVTVECGMEKTVPTVTDMSGRVLIPKGRAADVTAAVSASDVLTAPVEYGQTVGTVTVRLDGKALGVYSILTDDRVERITFGSVMRCMLGGLFGCGEEKRPRKPQGVTL